MEYKDIIQFTQIRSYQVNMPLRTLVEQIDKWSDDQNLVLNPDFQRGHVWTKEQQVAYIKYLLRGGKSSRVIYFNHPGWMRNWKGDFVCVDGLQRLTACLEFLSNGIKVFGTYFRNFEDDIPYDVDLLININNLQTRKEVLKWYIEINTGGTVHTEDQIQKVKKLLFDELRATGREVSK